MKITDVRVRRIKPEGKLKAWVSVTIDDAIAIHEIKVIDSEKGLFIVMPSKKGPEGDYIDTVHPINTETRKMLSDAVLDAYEKEVEKNGNLQ